MKSLEKSEIRENGAGFMPVPPGIAGNPPDKCDCFTYCGDDPAVQNGKVGPCEMSRRWEARKEMHDIALEGLAIFLESQLDPMPDGAVNATDLRDMKHVKNRSMQEFNDVCAQKQAALINTESSIDALIGRHGAMLEDNAYCYFELAYTRRTGWMAFICDKPAGGTVGTAEFGSGRKIIAQGQGATADAACADALAGLGAPA